MDNNNIKELPRIIGDLQDLKELSMKSNQLSQLPQSFSKLQSLQTLQLNHNFFSGIPTVLYSLSQLTSLYVSCCEMLTTTWELTCRACICREMEHNDLSSLPDSISMLFQLRAL